MRLVIDYHDGSVAALNVNTVSEAQNDNGNITLLVSLPEGSRITPKRLYGVKGYCVWGGAAKLTLDCAARAHA